MQVTTDILKSCAANDRRAQKQLYEYCYRMLINVCLRYNTNHEDARFAFNNGFLKIVTGLSSLDIDEMQFHGWAKRVMVNSLIDDYRKNKNHQHTIFGKETERELEIHGESASNSAEGEMQYKDIMNLLKTIPPISAHVFTLYVIDGYNHREIGEQLEITEGTSKWHLSTARKLLRDRLEAMEIEEKRFAI